MKKALLLLVPSLLLLACFITADGAPGSASESSYKFEKPVRLMVGDEPISVDSPGYACPTMADVDGDGKVDLVVGQFAGGSMKFYKNIADSGPPQFEKGVWIKTGGKKATVPGVW